jgi:hypothetical protein
MLLAVGCSSDKVSSNTTDQTQLNLTDEFGGYKATDEAPAFGDADIMALGEDEEANDPLSQSPEVNAIRNLTDVDVYSVEFLWGKLEFDSTETAITDWSGKISVDRGAIIAVRLIKFEGTDHIVRPRESREVLDFVSHTRPAYDGILVYVYDPEPTTYDTENTLTFETAPYTRTLKMSELADLQEIVDVGNNQVSITAVKLDKLDCGEGFLEGRWIRQGRDGKRGNFFGRWIASDGRSAGFIRGHFGTRADAPVFFGKWISLSGQFRGLLKGTWGYGNDATPDATNLGWFDGIYADAAGNEKGKLSGNWMARMPVTGPPDDQFEPGDFGQNDRNGRHAGRGYGSFSGQWKADCAE